MFSIAVSGLMSFSAVIADCPFFFSDTVALECLALLPYYFFEVPVCLVPS